MIWKFIDQLSKMEGMKDDKLKELKKDIDNMIGELNDEYDDLDLPKDVSSEDVEDKIWAVEGKEEIRDLKRLRDSILTKEDVIDIVNGDANQLKGELGKAFTLMFAYRALEFRSKIKETKRDKDEVKEVEEEFYGAVKNGAETIKEFGKTKVGKDFKLEEKLRKAFRAENLERSEEKSGVLTFLTNQERYSTRNFGENWGVIEYTLSMEEMNELVNMAVWEGARLGVTYKPGRRGKHFALKNFVVTGWKDGPFTVSTTGTLYQPHKIFTSAEVNGEEVSFLIPSVLTFDSLLFSRPFGDPNEDIVLRDAVIKELKLIARSEKENGEVGYKPIPLRGKDGLHGLLGSITCGKKDGSYQIETYKFRKELGMQKEDFWRTLGYIGKGNEEKIGELVDLGVMEVVDDEGNEIDVNDDELTEIADKLEINKNDAGLLSVAYAYARFYERAAEKLGCELEDLKGKDLKEVQKKAGGALKSAADFLGGYKELIENFRISKIRAEVDEDTINDALDKFYNGDKEATGKNKKMEGWLKGLLEGEKPYLYRLFYHSGKGRNLARGVVKQLEDVGL